MSKDRNLDHEFLDLRASDQADRTSMGGLRLAQRTRLFFLTGLAAAVAFAGMYVHFDRRLNAELDTWAAAEKMSRFVQAVETGIARARGDEKTFILKKDPLIAVAFKINLESVYEALDGLQRMPQSVTLRPHMSTIRDGLAQYAQQFNKLINSEKELGLTDGSGLSRKLKDVTEELQVKFSTAGYANLAGQVSRINQEGQETLLSGYKKGVDEIQKRYGTLITFLQETKIPGKNKKSLQDLLKRHETYLLAMINARFAFEEEAQRFEDILAYLAPSPRALSGFADKTLADKAAGLAKTQKFSRIAIGGGSAAILVVLVFIGLMVMRSMSISIRALAVAAGRLSDGDRLVNIPGRGNSDATGTVARALERWLDDLADLDHLRLELDQTRSKLEKAMAEAESNAMEAAEAARAALLSDETEMAAGFASGPDEVPGRFQAISAIDDAVPTGGPISSVSRQLASFSEYVTAAAGDVERTEGLIKGLEEANGQIEEMSSLVTSIRDQTNLMAFRTQPREEGAAADNVVILSGEDKEPAGDGKFTGADMAKRFDAIRDATDRAERTAQAVRNTMSDVTRMARDIAATASQQALEAISKLLLQSEYLQNMLDDVISKIAPARPGDMVDEDDKPKKSKKKKKKQPPKVT